MRNGREWFYSLELVRDVGGSRYELTISSDENLEPVVFKLSNHEEVYGIRHFLNEVIDTVKGDAIIVG